MHLHRGGNWEDDRSGKKSDRRGKGEGVSKATRVAKAAGVIKGQG
jgi:hypothetical protein